MLEKMDDRERNSRGPFFSFRKIIFTSKKGFTLIELVIVMVIVAILALTANAIFGDTPTTKAYGTARKIQSDIIFAQESAMSHRVHYRITFTPVLNSYTVQKCNTQTSPCPGWTNTNDPSTNTSPFTVTLNTGSYSGVTIPTTTFSGNYLEFNSAGTPLDGNITCGLPPCRFAAKESVTLNPGLRTISVIPGTGKTTIP